MHNISGGRSVLNTIFENKQELISFVHRLFGYICSGLNVLRIFILLFGLLGQNGKGLLLEIIAYVMGNKLARPIQAEMLLDQGRSRSSAGASPDIMSLKGIRIAFASETDENRRFSSSRVKWLSGGETLVGRAPFSKYETIFSPTHKLVLLTNHRPHASAYDAALWSRMIVVPFNLSFVNRDPRTDKERRADLYLMDKLKAEASGILNWIIEGFIQWQERGLEPPQIVLDAIEEYRKDEDVLDSFLEECCFRDESAKTSAAALYDQFDIWFQKNISKKGLSQKKFGTLMTRAGFEKIKSSCYMYIGIGLLSE